ncbi:MAG TPA: polymer-forming cytoskeletal protein [Micropepsaceae bacterium]|nr:polymer-forming cytoskeletal protein [Micropepsaceae bacterium]
MFSRGKDVVEPPTPPAQKTQRTVRSAPSIISVDLVVSGTLVSTGDMQVDGKVEGDIRSASLTIGEKAYVHGEIIAEEVVVRGKVMGGIRARKVQLASTCHVEGNILHEALSVESGAFFEGNCRHSGDPLGEKAASAASMAGAAARPAMAPVSNVGGAMASVMTTDGLGGAKPAAAAMTPAAKPAT